MAQIVLARNGVSIVRSYDLNNDVAGRTTDGTDSYTSRSVVLRLGGIGPISVHWDYIPLLVAQAWVKHVGVSQMYRVGPVSAVRQQARTECLVVLSIADSPTVSENHHHQV